MKKRVIVEIVSGILIFVIGFFIGDSSAINRVNKQISSKVNLGDTSDNTVVDKEPNENTPPLTIDQLPLNITIKEPDSIGNVYLNATFTNNSDKNITGYIATILLKDSNEKSYLSMYDTVLSGETSPAFKCFGPKTFNKDDIQILNYQINIDNGDGTTTYLEYDTKLNKYQW